METQIVVRTIPYILETIAKNLLTPENISNLANIIIGAIEKHGYNNQDKIIDIVRENCPECLAIASQALNILYKSIEVGNQRNISSSEEFMKIVDYAIAHQDMPTEKLLKIYIIKEIIRIIPSYIASAGFLTLVVGLLSKTKDIKILIEIAQQILDSNNKVSLLSKILKIFRR